MHRYGWLVVTVALAASLSFLASCSDGAGPDEASLARPPFFFSLSAQAWTDAPPDGHTFLTVLAPGPQECMRLEITTRQRGRRLEVEVDGRLRPADPSHCEGSRWFFTQGAMARRPVRLEPGDWTVWIRFAGGRDEYALSVTDSLATMEPFHGGFTAALGGTHFPLTFE